MSIGNSKIDINNDNWIDIVDVFLRKGTHKLRLVVYTSQMRGDTWHIGFALAPVRMPSVEFSSMRASGWIARVRTTGQVLLLSLSRRRRTPISGFLGPLEVGDAIILPGGTHTFFLRHGPAIYPHVYAQAVSLPGRSAPGRIGSVLPLR